MASSDSEGYIITDPDEQPFSPSVFLNLPPTPQEPEPEPEPANLSDHLVLPFISHIFMADDDDDMPVSYQYSDPQALFRAQQPFAEILSNTNVATNNDAMSSFGTSTWPAYNVVRRIRRGDHANTTPFLAEQDSNADKANTDKTATPGGAGSGVGEHNSSLFFSSGQMTQIKFFWQGSSDRHRYRLARWNILCRPKDQGGLGILDLQFQNKCLLAKWLVNLLNTDGMWQSMLRNKYLYSKTLTQVTARPNDSHFWRGLMRIKEEVMSNGSFDVKDGTKTRFWDDTWVIFRGAYWLRFWAQLQRDNQANDALVSISKKLKTIALEIANGGWKHIFRLL